MSTIRATAGMTTSETAYAQVEFRYGADLGEIDTGTARTIAGWWASSGTIGATLAALSQGQPVTVAALLADIYATRQSNTVSAQDGRALDMLATWAIRRDAD